MCLSGRAASPQSQGPGLSLRTAKGQTSIEKKIKLAKGFSKQRNAAHCWPDQRISEQAEPILDESSVFVNVSMLQLPGKLWGVCVSLPG